MIDFSELPKDGIRFEQLIRELLLREDYEVHWTGVGADGGRDLILTEHLVGPISRQERKWVVSCKHLAHSETSVGVDQITNIIDHCKSLNADGFILACSTQPSSGLARRFEEIQENSKLLVRVWDGIEIEKRLHKPCNYSLMRSFFPNSSILFEWKIYDTIGPGSWAAHYGGHYFYLACRISHFFPDLGHVEEIIGRINSADIYRENGWDSHYLELRAVYFNEKMSEYVVFVDYIYPNSSKDKLIDKKTLLSQLGGYLDMGNAPEWDIKYYEEYTNGDSFDFQNNKYYTPYLTDYLSGTHRGYW